MIVDQGMVLLRGVVVEKRCLAIGASRQHQLCSCYYRRHLVHKAMNNQVLHQLGRFNTQR